MDSYYRTLATLPRHNQPYDYRYLLKQEALMRLCAEQAQNNVPFYTKPFSHENLSLIE